jgi:hypothetical protein
MKSSLERIEHHTPPESVVEELLLAGGTNRFGEPLFRVVWGYDRIVPMHGEWQQWGQYRGTLTDKFTGYEETRQFTKLENSVIETRLVPKYLPGNCWHLEMWRPPEEYGTREQWRKLGEEVIGGLTIDTAGPYPERGEYELCYPLTHDGTSDGTPIPLITDVVVEIVKMIRYGRNGMSLAQRRSAIEQRVRREEEGYVKRIQDQLRDGLPAFHGETSVTVLKDEIARHHTGSGIGLPVGPITVPKGTGDKDEQS